VEGFHTLLQNGLGPPMNADRQQTGYRSSSVLIGGQERIFSRLFQPEVRPDVADFLPSPP
jgi:hypothetical protein